MRKDVENKIVHVAIEFILPDVKKSSTCYKELHEFIINRVEGEHNCCILWDRNEEFLTLLTRNGISWDAIEKKEVIIGQDKYHIYVRVRDHYIASRETLIFSHNKHTKIVVNYDEDDAYDWASPFVLF
jgi:hypothetical protein